MRWNDIRSILRSAATKSRKKNGPALDSVATSSPPHPESRPSGTTAGISRATDSHDVVSEPGHAQIAALQTMDSPVVSTVSDGSEHSPIETAHRCGLCNNLQKRDEDDARLGFDFTPAELHISASEKGCPLCLVILEALRQFEKDMLDDIRRVYARCCGTRGLHQDTLTLEAYFEDERPKLLLELYSPHSQAWEAILPRTRVSHHPESSEALRWVKSLLADCESNHEKCEMSSEPLLPKRVLAIGRDHRNETYKVQLLEPPSGSSAPYAALSHCWGHNRSCLTTKASFKARLNGIIWQTIPRTFQDAIRMALLLNYEFIWIDSLCIIQDDLEDWDTESAKMAGIYQNASIALSATTSSGDIHGCYDAENRVSEDVLVELSDDIEYPRVAVRKSLIHWHDVPPAGMDAQFPLLTRGWAYQERLLSRRLLHFAKSEMVWECRSLVACECGGVGHHSSPGREFRQAMDSGDAEKGIIADRQVRLNQIYDIRRAQEHQVTQRWIALARKTHKKLENNRKEHELDYLPGSIGFISHQSGAEYLRTAFNIPSWVIEYENLALIPAAISPQEMELDLTSTRECADYVFHFHRVIETYSALQLTKRSDRLPALSGICTLVQPIRGMFLAGLWYDSFCFDLMWRVDRLHSDSIQHNEAASYHGPSWSWVSNDRGVHYWTDIINFFDAAQLFGRDLPTEYAYISINQSQLDSTRPFARTTCLARNIAENCVNVKLMSSNPYGNVKTAVLSGEASMTAAILHYDLPMRYKLAVVSNDNQDIEMEFYADYSLSAPGSRHLPYKSELTLLLIHPQVALVLTQVQQKSHSKMAKTTPQYRRVGIARFPENRMRYYQVDWMRYSKVRKFILI